MRRCCKSGYACLLLLFLGACAPISQDLGNTRDVSACAGEVIQPPAGLVEVMDTELRQAAEGEPGKGKLCKAKIFLVQMPVAVYRIWDSAWPDRARGNWWTLNYPAGSRDSYRQAEAICPEWSGLDRLIVCTVKVGTRVGIGPAQSADCANGLSYASSAENQVYIPNDSRNQQMFVENCSSGAPWPDADP